MLISQCHFDGPSAKPPEANGPHDGPPEAHGPRGYCPPCPPLVGPGKMLCCLQWWAVTSYNCN